MFSVENISKRFRLYDKPSDRLKEILFRRSYHHSHLALDGVSFSVNEGETLGILGRNGAGKSTLLKILTGVLLPDEGSVRLDGKITGLLELGTGFEMNQSGLQNITTNGLLIGMTQQEIEQRRQEIIEFSELGSFINEPIRTYSSGMVMRLAFSIAIHAQPRCFVVDEALSVGDVHFQQKCMRRIKEFRKHGGSIIFVSHDLHAVKMLCDRVVVLDGGRIVHEGDAEEGVNFYNRLMADMEDEAFDLSPKDTQHIYGNGAAVISECRIEGAESGGSVVTSGEMTHFHFVIDSNEDLDEVTFGMLIRDRFGQDIYGTNSFLLERPLSLKKGQRLHACYSVPLDLGNGKYTLSAALHTSDHHLDECYYWNDQLASFEVSGFKESMFTGVCRLYPELRFSEQPLASGLIDSRKAG